MQDFLPKPSLMSQRDLLTEPKILEKFLRRIPVNTKIKHGDYGRYGLLSSSLLRLNDDSSGNIQFITIGDPLIVEGETMLGGHARIKVARKYTVSNGELTKWKQSYIVRIESNSGVSPSDYLEYRAYKRHYFQYRNPNIATERLKILEANIANERELNEKMGRDVGCVKYEREKEYEDFSVTLTKYYTVMENGGIDLSVWSQVYVLECDKVLDAFLQACKQNHRLHLAGYVHGDIKSENFLIDKKTQKVMLIDFGASFPLNKSKRPMTLSPGRTSIEYIHACYRKTPKYGAEYDVFSLGVTLFELLLSTIQTDDFEEVRITFNGYADEIQRLFADLAVYGRGGFNSIKKQLIEVYTDYIAFLQTQIKKILEANNLWNKSMFVLLGMLNLKRVERSKLDDVISVLQRTTGDKSRVDYSPGGLDISRTTPPLREVDPMAAGGD